MNSNFRRLLSSVMQPVVHIPRHMWRVVWWYMKSRGNYNFFFINQFLRC